VLSACLNLHPHLDLASLATLTTFRFGNARHVVISFRGDSEHTFTLSRSERKMATARRGGKSDYKKSKGEKKQHECINALS
jgi:hypothetical protein